MFKAENGSVQVKKNNFVHRNNSKYKARIQEVKAKAEKIFWIKIRAGLFGMSTP